MAPLAGKPPFATDEPDHVFSDQSKPVPRPRRQKVDATATDGARDSSYTAFDSYFAGNALDARLSGVGDIGRGLMNAGSDLDDSSDDEHPPKKKQTPSVVDSPSDKHRALYAAATGASLEPAPPYERDVSASTQKQQLQPQAQQPPNLRIVKQPQPVVHSRGDDRQMSRHLEAAPTGLTVRSQERQLPAALQSGIRSIVAPAPAHSRPPQAAFMQGSIPGLPPNSPNSPGSPYFTGLPGSPGATARTPQPLPPPQSPIMPVFARPHKESNAVTFEEKGGILRGNSEETLLPRGVGGRGDDFWRRFSMVAKEEAKSGSKSAWLRKTESGSTRLSTWVWLAGIILLLAIGGGIGVGWFFTHNKPSHPPVAIGGSADEGFTSSSSSVSAASTTPTAVTAAPVPTNTNNNNNKRDVDGLFTTATVPPQHRMSTASRKLH